MRLAVLAVLLAACTYDPRGVLNHGADGGGVVDAGATSLDAIEPDAIDVSPSPDATPPDATPPDAEPEPEGCEPACPALTVCCSDGTCALVGLCL